MSLTTQCHSVSAPQLSDNSRSSHFGMILLGSLSFLQYCDSVVGGGVACKTGVSNHNWTATSGPSEMPISAVSE